MNETILINKQFTGTEDRNALYDLCITKEKSNHCIVFMHGYMGFKDWGAWNLVQKYFISEGYNFAKFNVSHNGTTIAQPIEFIDLDAFAINSYWKEQCDLKLFMEYLMNSFGFTHFHLIGHSRAGGNVLLVNELEQVKSITTWAAISSIEKRMKTDEALDKWKTEGVYFIENGRTYQSMPHSYLQFEEFIAHKNELDIEQACKNNSKPICIIHGENDTSVKIEESEEISAWTNTPIHRIKNCNHTFETTQPWNEKFLSSQLLEVCQITSQFISKHQ